MWKKCVNRHTQQFHSALRNCCRCSFEYSIRVSRGKNIWRFSVVSARAWKGFTDENSSVKPEEIGWLRDIYKDIDSALRKQLLFS